ncbi:hypothetical protein RRG08_066861 [Elysia crispata]|uniref:Uncharacterized protein n=1 Tax=Elysia crispata TaxID=231223 RepID=A0AAE1APX0_9GAST|nr:hypothetical protein RRG08_066861 [Elysia crispata]
MYNWNTWMVMEVSYFVTPATETGFRTSCFSDQPKCSAFPVRATSFFVTLTRSELGIDEIQASDWTAGERFRTSGQCRHGSSGKKRVYIRSLSPSPEQDHHQVLGSL